MATQDGFETDAGNGGETHQHVPAEGPHGGEGHLTTNQGIRVSDNQNQLKTGPRGPVLLEDFVLREKIFHFDHERIPERIVHARGSAAHGYFETYESLADLTRADLFQRAGERTPVFTRFSTVAGGAGSVDTPRDVRGFAVKFYTKEGNWDLVGNNIPVFFIQDAMKFPDLVHAVKMEADRGFPQAATAHDTFWDFIGLMPEAMHRHSTITGVEIDPITARIAKALYPDADIRTQGFENAKLADGFFDVAISNVPFGDYPVHDPSLNAFRFPIHDYFFAKSLEKVRPGGLIMFITSRGTMDKLDSTLREYLAPKAELLGAIRLPNTAFKQNAGTEVTTDIVMLRKLHPGETPRGPRSGTVRRRNAPGLRPVFAADRRC